MSLHIIHFMKSINADTLNTLQTCTLKAIREGASEIQIHISSDGSNVDQGFAAYQFLRSLSIPVTMHCIGNVESMAIIMYLAGSKRFIVPHDKIKIHSLHWDFLEGAVDHDRLVEYADSLDFDAKRYADIFEERTHEAKKIVNVRSHLAGRAKFLNAVDAVDSGISTGIVDVKISVPHTSVWWV